MGLDKTKIAVIGAGFAGLSSAAYLAKEGYDITIFEKNSTTGGRARQLRDQGYVFDMGPSWYWMPEVFENFFKDFGYQVADFYELLKLDPAFTLIFGREDQLQIPAGIDDLYALFESIEAGSARQLKAFLTEAEFKYRTGMDKLVFKPGLSLMEFADLDLFKGIVKLQVFTSFSKHVRRFFKDPRLIALMEFPVLFLGAMPADTPALYSLMNFAGLTLGTWYPKGGFGQVVSAMQTVCERLGVKFLMDEPVTGFRIANHKITGVQTASGTTDFDGIIAAADYHHIEHDLLNISDRNYSDQYWEKRVMAPSALIFYLGVKGRINNLDHHTLFFDSPFEQHAKEIYRNPQWPTDPLFYVCCPSKSDDSVAPPGHENLFVLMPLAPGLTDSKALREQYFNLIMARLETHTGMPIRELLDYQKSYCLNDFKSDYNAYKGNAYGLANTLLQTANFKPSIRNRQLKNLFYAGQLTVPGPGVPPSIISGKVAASQLSNHLNSKK